METHKILGIIMLLGVLIGGIIFASNISISLWSDKSEKVPEFGHIIIKDNMTVMEFGKQNSIPNPVLKKVFSLENKKDLQKKLSDFGISSKEIISGTTKAMALSAEHESKNWLKIPLKFGLWFIFLAVIFFVIRKTKITGRQRKVFYLLAIVLFGVTLSADPSPMGTVKDAVHLYATKYVIFPPRMIALSIFLMVVLIANKFICAWGCQLGTLQDLIFRINRNKKDTKGIIKQYKPPFWFTNTFRLAFFVLFTLVAFMWAIDIFEKIDPFKIYKPQVITTFGWLFIGSLLIVSLFVYRPWCQLFCPFGLIGWFVEKISLFKIKVDYKTCVECEACTQACPSTVMSAILKRDKTIPDCFACGTCINVCPTDSIKFAMGKREKPPAGKFDKN